MPKTIITKTCRICKEVKPVSDFYKDLRNKNGYKYSCKNCLLKYVKEYHQTKKGKATQIRSYQSATRKISGRKASRKYKKTEKGIATRKRFDARHPNHRKAGLAVKHAIRAGKLPHPNTKLCHYCPKPAQQYHHWHGYEPEHWLDVIPICLKCHSFTFSAGRPIN